MMEACRGGHEPDVKSSLRWKLIRSVLAFNVSSDAVHLIEFWDDGRHRKTWENSHIGAFGWTPCSIILLPDTWTVAGLYYMY